MRQGGVIKKKKGGELKKCNKYYDKPLKKFFFFSKGPGKILEEGRKNKTQF